MYANELNPIFSMINNDRKYVCLVNKLATVNIYEHLYENMYTYFPDINAARDTCISPLGHSFIYVVNILSMNEFTL